MTPRGRIILRIGLAGLLLAAAWLSGCVPSESSRYQRTISGSVPPQATASADVAREFGLSGGNDTTLSLGAADR